LQRLVANFSNKNGQSAIFEQINKEANDKKRKIKGLTADDLDRIVRKVFEQIKRNYDGLTTSSREDPVISSSYLRNEKEYNELLSRIFAFKREFITA
jgi:hypothetical protein